MSNTDAALNAYQAALDPCAMNALKTHVALKDVVGALQAMSGFLKSKGALEKTADGWHIHKEKIQSEDMQALRGFYTALQQSVHSKNAYPVLEKSAPMLVENTRRILNAPGKVVRLEWITRATLKANPDVLFLFGDNMERRGFGGQAREMRGEPNSVGVPTKNAPSMDKMSFFSNGDFERFVQESGKDFARLGGHLSKGGVVVFPSGGIGTGLARLNEMAPKIAAHIEAQMNALENTTPDLSHTSAEHKKKIYTGIGSRETPPPVQQKMTQVAKILCQRGWQLRSGGAKGSDDAFEKGIVEKNGQIDPKKAEIFLPWDGFKTDPKDPNCKPKLARHGYIVKEIPGPLIKFFSENWTNPKPLLEQIQAQNKGLLGSASKKNLEGECKGLELVRKYHGKPGALSKGALGLMARNGNQMFGSDWSQLTSVVVCWTEGGKGGGGTGQAIRIAKDLGVRVLDLGDARFAQWSAEQIANAVENPVLIKQAEVGTEPARNGRLPGFDIDL